MRSRLIAAILAAHVALAWISVGAPTAGAAACQANGPTFCVHVDGTNGAPGAAVGVSVIAPCFQMSTAELLFDSRVDAHDAVAPLRPGPGGPTSFLAVVPDAPVGPYRLWFKCQGLEAVDLGLTFRIVLAAPNTDTSIERRLGGQRHRAAPIDLVALAALGVILVWLHRRRRV